MPRLVTLARASRLVGVPRNTLQKQVREGNLTSFEGMVSLGELSELYPDTQFEDNNILERLERIMDNAAIRAREQTTSLPPDVETLATRVGILSDEIVEAKLEISIYSTIFDKLKSRLNQYAQKSPELKSITNELKDWVNAELEEISNKKFDHYQITATDTLLRIMAATVRLEPSGHEFLLDGSSSILDAALASGLAVNYGCSNGNCGKCKARVLSGEVKKIHHHDYVLNDQEKINNYILTCSNTAVTDIVLEADEAHTENDIPQQNIRAKVRKIQFINDDMCVLTIKTPRTERLRFLAGQKINLATDDNTQTSLPIASCPCDDMNIQFHIQRNDQDSFANYVFNDLKNGDMITIDGPQGQFVSNVEDENPVVFVAFGTGFAPIKSLIEHTMTLDLSGNIYLYWVVEDKRELYLHNHCRAWKDAFEHFIYHPVITSEPGENNKLPLVPALQDNDDIKNTQFFICGAEQQVSELVSNLENQSGVPAEHIMAETI